MKCNKSTFHGLLTGSFWALISVVVMTIVVHFSWNMAVPELFGETEMSFKNAFGLVLLGAVVQWIAVSRRLNCRVSDSISE